MIQSIKFFRLFVRSFVVCSLDCLFLRSFSLSQADFYKLGKPLRARCPQAGFSRHPQLQGTQSDGRGDLNASSANSFFTPEIFLHRPDFILWKPLSEEWQPLVHANSFFSAAYLLFKCALSPKWSVCRRQMSEPFLYPREGPISGPYLQGLVSPSTLVLLLRRVRAVGGLHWRVFDLFISGNSVMYGRSIIKGFS